MIEMNYINPPIEPEGKLDNEGGAE